MLSIWVLVANWPEFWSWVAEYQRLCSFLESHSEQHNLWYSATHDQNPGHSATENHHLILPTRIARWLAQLTVGWEVQTSQGLNWGVQTSHGSNRGVQTSQGVGGGYKVSKARKIYCFVAKVLDLSSKKSRFCRKFFDLAPPIENPIYATDIVMNILWYVGF